MAWQNNSGWGGFAAGLTSPVAVADGGTGSTTASGARTNLGLGSAAVEALTTDGATVSGALGAADRRVPTPNRLPTGTGMPPSSVNGSLTTLTVSALRIYYVPVEFWLQDDYASLQIEVTTLSAGNAKLGVYAQGASDGRPDAKIWDSGSFSVGSAGVKNITFAAGTWSDTSYKNGNNFRAKGLGERLYLAFQTDTGVVPAVRAFPAAGRRLLWISSAMGASPNIVEVFTAAGTFGLPANAGSFSDNANVAGVLITPLKV